MSTNLLHVPLASVLCGLHVIHQSSSSSSPPCSLLPSLSTPTPSGGGSMPHRADCQLQPCAAAARCRCCERRSTRPAVGFVAPRAGRAATRRRGRLLALAVLRRCPSPAGAKASSALHSTARRRHDLCAPTAVQFVACLLDSLRHSRRGEQNHRMEHKTEDTAWNSSGHFCVPSWSRI